MTGRRLLLLRHGESAWNAMGRWQGRADPPLSELGERQAVAAARTLAADPPDVVWASPLARAARTAELMALELGRGPVRTDDDLVERDVGEWSGLTRADIEVRYPGWLDAPTDKHAAFGPSARPSVRRPPGWEPDESVLNRCLAALGRIARAMQREDRGSALVVAHGGLTYVLEGHLGQPSGRLANLGGRWVTVDDDSDLGLGPRVLLLDPEDVVITVPPQQ